MQATVILVTASCAGLTSVRVDRDSDRGRIILFVGGSDDAVGRFRKETRGYFPIGWDVIYLQMSPDVSPSSRNDRNDPE